MNIILFGFKMSGKSYLGSLLAKKLSFHFIESDRLIEDEYVKMEGVRLSCRQIYLEIGSGPFRLLERKVLSRLSLVKDSVISLGGGSLLDLTNVKTIQSLGVMIYLNTPKNILEQRIFSDTLPAFIDPQNPKDSFHTIYKQRKALYQKIPAYRLDLNGKTDDELIEEIIQVVYGK